jgi:hypothetical protein
MTVARRRELAGGELAQQQDVVGGARAVAHRQRAAGVAGSLRK